MNPGMAMRRISGFLQTKRVYDFGHAKDCASNAEMLWRLRDRALLMRGETPQIPACLRRLTVRLRQASNRSGDSAPKRHEPSTHDLRLRFLMQRRNVRHK
ncbi:hypothetical protein NBRC111894_3617 [Sporolactobacillus inulinus]|uniref:Uncharacterized protein n=1 Tax=Sporolactobacillus inulinus TaxID=2078 RepID=A0A4Y1ZGG0_9BACL|nr:hypothetical protein NBRC111894_3617 [Sporolactobacillus inulinus]